MQSSSLRDLLVLELADLRDAENQLIKALPKMAKASSSEPLRQALREHWEQTKEHAQRIDRIFTDLGESPETIKCKGMMGIIAEGSDMLKRKLSPELQDAAIISAAQRVEHYEIAAYGCVRTYAELLQNQDAVEALEQTLQEEKDADSRLTDLAQQINIEAQTTGDAAEEEARRAKGASS